MNGSVVVDASLAVKWLIEEDDSDKAHATLQSWVAQDHIQSLFRILAQHGVALKCAKSLELPQNGFYEGINLGLPRT